MQRRWSVPVISGLVALLSVVLLSELGTVSGAIPNPGDGRFYACFVKKTRVVKVLNYPKVGSCPRGQELIDWSRTGPQGLQGPAGLPGPGGPEGAQGVQGPAGPASPADWNAIANKPVDFADGIDAIGPSYASSIIHTGPAIAPGDSAVATLAFVSRDIDFHFSVIPTTNNGILSVEEVRVNRLGTGLVHHTVVIRNESNSVASGFKVRALAFGDGIAPAALKRLLQSAKVTVVKRKRG